MQEYRFIFTGTFNTATERDKAADWLESKVALLGAAGYIHYYFMRLR